MIRALEPADISGRGDKTPRRYHEDTLRAPRAATHGREVSPSIKMAARAYFREMAATAQSKGHNTTAQPPHLMPYDALEAK